MDQRRRFNAGEHKALYLASGGLCECAGCGACGPGGCGAPLEPGWHADHDEPHSRGGKTHVSNGLAKCPACNESKGNRMSGVPLLPWQEDAVNLYKGAGAPPRFLLAAVPGGGKTITAVAIAREVRRFTIVLVPQDDIVSDWRADLHSQGICPAEIKKGKDGRSIAVGTICPSCGTPASAVVMTYAFSAANPDILCKLLRERGPALLILDEIHHLRDGGAWLEPIKTAWPFAGHIKVLCLSGTPFRTDEESVPFIHTAGPFKGEMAMIPAEWVVEYSYGKAVGDKPPAVTQVIFERYDGDIEWLEESEDGEKRERSARLSGEHGKNTARKVRRHALNPAGNWLREVLSKADAKVQELRQGDDPRAGALTVCRNTDHAADTADLLTRIQSQPVFVYTQSYSTRQHLPGNGRVDERTGERTGNEIRVRLANGADGSVLDAYKESDAPHLVTVRKVSEGVNVPRLRVLVYATITRTMLFFMQVLGRVIRINRQLPKTADQTAWVFMPDEIEMRAFAAEIEQGAASAMVRDVLDDDEEEQDPTGMRDGTGNGSDGGPREQFLRSEADYSGATYSGQMHDADFMSIVRRVNRPEAEVIPVVRELAASGLLNLAALQPAATPATADSHTPIDPHAERNRAITKMRKAAKSWAALRLKNGEFRSYAESIAACNREVGNEHGVWAENPDITLGQAEKARSWIADRVRDIYYGNSEDDNALPF